jgi:2-keto-4-pentenoate hydratase/2-oxohepta-3-ene-1,7-dioic acid hydratase in catechol pathway
MKFATISTGTGTFAVVRVDDRNVLPISVLARGVDTTEALIETGGAALDAIASGLQAKRWRSEDLLAIDGLRWHAPVRRPGKILCVALNNSALDPFNISVPSFPAYFEKPSSALTGHREPIELLPSYGLTHPEPELAVVIGRKGRFIQPDEALDYVFGYTIINDVTSVTMRKEDHFHVRFPTPDGGEYKMVEEHVSYPARYKGCDTFAPLGPWLTTRDEIPNPNALQVRCWLGDDLIMDDNTANMRSYVPRVLQWMSHHQTLHPGDVIAMGTALSPKRDRPISYGDMNKLDGDVRIEIEGLGTLVNPVRRREAEDPRLHFQR